MHDFFIGKTQYFIDMGVVKYLKVSAKDTKVRLKGEVVPFLSALNQAQAENKQLICKIIKGKEIIAEINTKDKLLFAAQKADKNKPKPQKSHMITVLNANIQDNDFLIKVNKALDDVFKGKTSKIEVKFQLRVRELGAFVKHHTRNNQLIALLEQAFEEQKPNDFKKKLSIKYHDLKNVNRDIRTTILIVNDC